MRYFLTLYLISSFSAVSFSINENSDQVEIKKIANAGVLISFRNQSILIDGLFENEFEQYEHPSRDKIDELSKADNITHILITHGHGDHYSRNIVDEFFATNSKYIILPRDLRVNVSNPDSANRVGDINFYTTLDMYKPTEFPLENGKITSFRVPHVGGYSIANNAYLIELSNGFKILHTGDGDISKIKKKNVEWLFENEIDLAFIPFFEIGTNVELFQEGKIKKIIPVHFDKRIDDIEGQLNSLSIPNLCFFNKAGNFDLLDCLKRVNE